MCRYQRRIEEIEKELTNGTYCAQKRARKIQKWIKLNPWTPAKNLAVMKTIGGFWNRCNLLRFSR